MDLDYILKYCLTILEDTILEDSCGERCIFYNPRKVLKKGIYILTVKEHDGNNDKSSNLDRKGIYRVNLGIKKNTFIDMFGIVPKRPRAG